MANKTIRLTEAQLQKMINRSVNKILSESSNINVWDLLNSAKTDLSEIMYSGFIPFSSPSPSSTEQIIKDSIIAAHQNIVKALSACKDCGYC